MSLTLVQSIGASGSNTVTFTSPVTAGNLVIAWITYQSSGSNIRTPSFDDNKGNPTYTLIDGIAKTVTGTHYLAALYYQAVPTGGTGFIGTYTVSNSGNATVTMAEYSFTGTLSLDAFNASISSSSGTSLTSGSMTTTGPSDLVVGVGIASANGQTWTAGSGFTALFTEAGSSGISPICAVAQTGVAPGSISASMTDTTSSGWACCGAAFSAATPVGTGVLVEAHDSFAGSGHFSDLGTLSATGGSDTASFAGKFTSPAAMAKTESHDTFAGSAKFITPATMAKTEAHDAFAGDGFFSDLGTMSAHEQGDSFAGTAIGPTARIAAVGHSDTFSGSATVNDIGTISATERGDTMSCFAQVSPFLRAREAGDVFTGSGSSTTSTSSMAVTERGDTMVATAGFSFDVTATFHPTEHGDTFSATGTQSSSAAMAAHEHGDSFHGSSSVHVAGSLSATEVGDVMRAGFERAIYSVYSNAGHGDPIDYGTSVDVTDALTYTTAPLAFPGTWKFAARARWAVSGLEEQNIDCMVSIILDASGKDITNQPPAPSGLRAFPLSGGTIRAEWLSPPTTGPKTPQGFHVYTGVGSVDYSTVIATISYGSAIFGSFVANLTGFADGITYLVGVRAFNGTSEENNTIAVAVTAIATGPTAVSGLTAVATSRSS